MKLQFKIYPTNHPYYQSEGCYYSNEAHMEFDSLQDFLKEFEDADLDMNRVICYDWEKIDPEDFEEGEDKTPELRIYFMKQRKAAPLSCYMKVEPTKENQERVYKFLEKHYKQSQLLWAEFSGGGDE